MNDREHHILTHSPCFFSLHPINGVSGAISSSLDFQAGNKAGNSTKLVRPGGWLMFFGTGAQHATASALAQGLAASLTAFSVLV